MKEWIGELFGSKCGNYFLAFDPAAAQTSAEECGVCALDRGGGADFVPGVVSRYLPGTSETGVRTGFGRKTDITDGRNCQFIAGDEAACRRTE